jgi:hypothetical protein
LGFDPKIPRKRFVNIASNKEKKQFKKKAKKIISAIPKKRLHSCSSRR